MVNLYTMGRAYDAKHLELELKGVETVTVGGILG
jgi:hypothetical protein